MWPVLEKGAASPRSVIPVSSNALISWPYKLVMGKQGGKGWWSAAMHPNKTSPKNDDKGCPSGCVFHLDQDPEERLDISAQLPEVLAKLHGLLDAYKETRFQTSEIPGYDNCVSIEDYVKTHAVF